MLRGLETRHEQNPQQLLRDTRTLTQRMADFFKNSVNVGICLVMGAVLGFFIPGITDLILICGTAMFIYNITRKTSLPFRMPLRSKMIDYNDVPPGTNKAQRARGIAYFGNEISTNEELWFNNEDMRTHVLIFGSTGSGKTEALISLAYNALLYGSGFIYVDGKGDNSLFAKIFSLARSVGREDDLLLVNYMTGARDIVGPQERRISNTLNPFANGSSSMLAQLVVSLLDASSATPDGDMWKGRAISFVEALMKILVYMRDQGHILLDANTVRNYFHLDRLEAMAIDKQFIRDDQEPVSLDNVPDVVLEPIKNYLATLPGFDKTKKGKQGSQTYEQHGFITMQLTRAFTSLADTYGHIIRTKLAEVDLRDVVLNRRILVVLLPALEKSPDELSNLGKVIIATLKAMMASGLGEQVEGGYREIIQRKPTNAATPFLCILDEYGYYAVPGFAVVPAQARSLGFSVIFAGQDLPAFQKASKEEAASIGANTNIKICMKLEDPIETWEFFSKTAGEAYVTKVDAFQTRAESVFNQYMDTRSASSEKRARIDLLDLKDQRQGEAHIFFKSKIIRARMFYANPQNVKYMRLNQFLRVDKPPTRVLKELEKRFANFQQVIDNRSYTNPVTPVESEEIGIIAQNINNNEFLDPIERSVTALLAYHNRSVPKPVELTEEVSHDELNLFTKMRFTSLTQQLLLVQDSAFTQELLNKSQTRANLETLERVSGKTERHAASIANEIVNDMQLATRYPPEMPYYTTRDEAIATINDLVYKIQQARLQGSTQDF